MMLGSSERCLSVCFSCVILCWFRVCTFMWLEGGLFLAISSICWCSTWLSSNSWVSSRCVKFSLLISSCCLVCVRCWCVDVVGSASLIVINVSVYFG